MSRKPFRPKGFPAEGLGLLRLDLAECSRPRRYVPYLFRLSG